MTEPSASTVENVAPRPASGKGAVENAPPPRPASGKGTAENAAPRPASRKSNARRRPKLTLLWRVSGLIWGLLFLAILVPTVLTIRSNDHLLRKNLVDHGTTLAATVGSATSNLVANEDTNSLQAVLLALIQGDSLIAGARICDKTGNAVCDSREEERGTTIAGLLTPPAQTETKEISRPAGPNVFQVSTPLFKYGDPWGTFQFELSLSNLDDEIDATVERSLWTGLVVLALGTLAAAWLARALTSPIAKLAAAAAEVAKGNFAARTGLSSSDEIGELAKTFDHMTSELAKVTNELRARSSSLERQVTRRKQALESRNVELEEVKKQVEVASRSRDESLSTLSQEMRAPVDQIIGMADVALDTHLSPEQRQYVTFAKESALGLRVMLMDCAEFVSRLEQGGAESVPIGFNLRDIVGDILYLFASKAQAKGLELIGEVLPDVPDTLVGNPDRVRQVLLNLVGNAIKLTREGEVVLRVEKETLTEREAGLHFIIRDTGPGIALEKVAAVREALDTSKDAGGRTLDDSMLGFAISEQLAETLGGKVWFESVEGKGCTFHFSARFRVEPRATNASDEADADLLAELHALVVTSNATLRNALEERLSAWGMKVSVTDGPGAVTALEDARGQGRRTDVVLLDSGVSAVDHHALWKAVEANPGLFGELVLLGAGEENGNEAAWWSSVAHVAIVDKPVKESDLLHAIAGGTQALVETAAR